MNRFYTLEIYRGISADAKLERKNELNIIYDKEIKSITIGNIHSPSAPSASIILTNELNSTEITCKYPLSFQFEFQFF